MELKLAEGSPSEVVYHAGLVVSAALQDMRVLFLHKLEAKLPSN